MATLYISYFGSVRDHVAGDPISTETVTTSTTTQASGVIPQGAKVASLYSDTAHYVTIGTGTPSAAITNGCLVPASTEKFISIGFNSASRKFAAVTLS